MLVIAVLTQADARLLEAGSLYVQDERIQKAIAYIEEHFRSKLRRSQMAGAAHLSDFYFSRLFRRLVGFSPEAYVLNCRLRYVAKLLALCGPECSIADVAADTGFADHSHFGRLLRRAFGQTPQQYRRRPRLLPTYWKAIVKVYKKYRTSAWDLDTLNFSQFRHGPRYLFAVEPALSINN